MDDRLQTALDFSKYRQTLAIQRKLLKEKLQAKLTYGTAGGIFHIDHSLIAFVQLCIDQGINSKNILFSISLYIVVWSFVIFCPNAALTARCLVKVVLVLSAVTAIFSTMVLMILRTAAFTMALAGLLKNVIL